MAAEVKIERKQLRRNVGSGKNIPENDVERKYWYELENNGIQVEEVASIDFSFDYSQKFMIQ